MQLQSSNCHETSLQLAMISVCRKSYWRSPRGPAGDQVIDRSFVPPGVKTLGFLKCLHSRTFSDNSHVWDTRGFFFLLLFIKTKKGKKRNSSVNTCRFTVPGLGGQSGTGGASILSYSQIKGWWKQRHTDRERERERERERGGGTHSSPG